MCSFPFLSCSSCLIPVPVGGSTSSPQQRNSSWLDLPGGFACVCRTSLTGLLPDTPARATLHPHPQRSEAQLREALPLKLLSVNNPNSSLCSLSPKGGSCFPHLLPLGHLKVFFLLLWSLVNNSTHYQFLYQLQSEQKLVWFLPPDEARLDSPLGASLQLALTKLNKVGNSSKLVFSDKEPVVQRNW